MLSLNQILSSFSCFASEEAQASQEGAAQPGELIWTDQRDILHRASCSLYKLERVGWEGQSLLRDGHHHSMDDVHHWVLFPLSFISLSLLPPFSLLLVLVVLVLYWLYFNYETVILNHKFFPFPVLLPVPVGWGSVWVAVWYLVAARVKPWQLVFHLQLYCFQTFTVALLDPSGIHNPPKLCQTQIICITSKFYHQTIHPFRLWILYRIVAPARVLGGSCY